MALILTFGVAGANLATACTLYTGENSLPALTHQKEVLQAAIRTRQANLFCELAHLEYRLSDTEPDRRLLHLDRCADLADRAISLNPENGIGYFLKGLCLGKSGETRGILASLGIVTPFKENMETAARLAPDLEHGGPHRALGRLYFKLPELLGGDLEKSIHHLEQAVHYGPDYWLNHFFLAEAYAANRQFQSAQKEVQRAAQLQERNSGDAEARRHRQELASLADEIQNALQSASVTP